jgi:hypothetical protein
LQLRFSIISKRIAGNLPSTIDESQDGPGVDCVAQVDYHIADAVVNEYEESMQQEL